MLPLRDDQPRTTVPYVTLSIIAINLAVFGYELSLSEQNHQIFFSTYAEVPHYFQLALNGVQGYSLGNAFLTIFTSMFMHAGWLHVLGNMWFLWIFGDNIEDHLGHAMYALFYLLCGFLASMAHVFANPTSDIPTLGASGAIAGVMGAYFILFPTARVLTWFVFFVFWLPAWLVLGYWFVVQFLSGAATTLSAQSAQQGGGVAVWAHVGGFISGLLLVKLLPARRHYLSYEG